MRTKNIAGLATAALLASVAVPVTNNLANIHPTDVVDAALTSQQQSFLNVAVPNAEAASAKYGTYTSVMLAQAILESGWGGSGLATEANNLFGMKGSYNGQSYTVGTSEWSSSTGYYNITAAFRKYPSWAESFQDNGYKLRTGTSDNTSRYKMTWIENASNYQVATQGLKDGGYATSPTYPQSLNNVISNYNLTQYDPTVDTTAKTMRATSSAQVYSGPADPSVVSAVGSISAGQTVNVDKTITYKNGTSYVHTGNGWVNASALTGSSSSSETKSSTSTGNFVSERGVKKVNYVPGYGVMIWKNAGGTGALGRYLEHGTEWKVFGYEMVNGHKWYNLGGSQWIDASYLVDPSTPIAGEKTSSSSDNKSSDSAKSSTIEGATVVPFTAVGRVNYVPGYGIMIWRQPASGALGRYLPHGSRWKVFKKATLKNGSVWYNLGGDQWIDANYLVIE